MILWHFLLYVLCIDYNVDEIEIFIGIVRDRCLLRYKIGYFFPFVHCVNTLSLIVRSKYLQQNILVNFSLFNQHLIALLY